MTRVTILGASFLVVIFVSLYTSTATARTNGFFNNKPGPGIKDEDPYKVLGVRRTATADDVQRAYRQRARETHRECNFDLSLSPIAKLRSHPLLSLRNATSASSLLQSSPQPTKIHPPTRTKNSAESRSHSKYWAIQSTENGTTRNTTKTSSADVDFGNRKDNGRIRDDVRARPNGGSVSGGGRI